jgi:hypothetical protein
MSPKPPARPKDGKPRSLSDSDIVSTSSARRTPSASGTDADTDKAPKASDRAAAADTDTPVARTPPKHRAGGESHKDRD